MNNKIIENFICTAPWEGLYVDPDGEFRVCCAGKSLGNLNDTSIVDLIENGKLKELQHDILTKGHSDYCKSCMDSHNMTGSSLRDSYGKDLSKVDLEKFVPNILDIRWRNTCQLRCIYCKPEWSSTHAEFLNVKIEKSKKNWQEEVLSFIEDRPNIKRVSMLGGEPFLMKENERLVDSIPDSARVVIVTNFAIENIHLIPLYQKLLKKSFSVLVSLENVGRKFEYVRRNAKFSVLEENCKRLEQDSKSSAFQMTYNLLSATALLETFDWVYSMHPNPNNNFSILSNLVGPDHLNIHLFPKEVKQIAIDQIEQVELKYKDWLNDSQNNFLAGTKKSLQENINGVKLHAIKRFFDQSSITDTDLDKSIFKEEWSELYSIISKYI